MLNPNQHYNNFVERFKNFPIKVCQLSRLVNKSEAEKNIEMINNLISGIALGACLHYKKQSISFLKKELLSKNIYIRESNNQNFNFDNYKPLKNIKIGIINYDMGN